ncbi:MAG: acetyltransferase [Solirubrobacterales bacterium]
MKKIVLIGAGGHCKVIIDIIQSTKEYEIVGITDTKETGIIFDIPVIGNDDILQELYKTGVEYAFISIGSINDFEKRNKIFKMIKSIGFKIPVLIHKSAIVSQFSSIEEGTCIMAGAVINPGTIIGENCIINTGSVVEHDCMVGNNTHISPNASIAGNVAIGCNTHIGIGSTVIQGKTLGENVTIGAGAVVIDDIIDNSLAVGVPAKVIKIK